MPAAELREEIGEVVIVKKTQKGLLIQPSRRVDFLEEFKKTIASEPKRTGKPENWPPSKMKRIWRS